MAVSVKQNDAVKSANRPTRGDLLALWGGIVFSALFTGLIWLLGSRLDAIELLPDSGVAWYYWRLPEQNFWSRATAWGFYLAHQISLWGLIYYAQSHKKHRYTNGLHRVNIIALGVNALFAFIHLLQTHIWYDALAQDVSIFTSQASVIVLLVWVLLMENSRRGLVFGKKAPISKEIIRFAREYHGYFFAWAVVYTYWYHPMVATSGHLIGFFYTFLLLLQSSLFYTRIHTNRWWTFALEFTVLVHGTLVAVMQGNGIWPMFFFGFAGIFVITQMHGLGLSLRVRALLLAAFSAFALYIYSDRGWEHLNEIIRIPVIDYVAVFILAGIFWLGLRIAGLVRGYRLERDAISQPSNGDD
jgi:hypothetical protein